MVVGPKSRVGKKEEHLGAAHLPVVVIIIPIAPHHTPSVRSRLATRNGPTGADRRLIICLAALGVSILARSIARVHIRRARVRRRSAERWAGASPRRTVPRVRV
jgi:hypothetical protein